MKKIISLILIAVMLLGALPALAFAQTQGTASFTGYTVSLGESIAVEFYAKAENLTNFGKVVFYKDGVEMTTITSCPAAEANGRVYFKFSQLGPHEMDATITAKLYLEGAAEPVDTKKVSVLGYCTAVYARGNEKLNTLIVNMLNYGAAAETYMNDGTAISEHATSLGIDLSATGDATVNKLTSTVYQEVEGATVEITKAALVLNSGIVPRFTFTTEENVDNLTAMVSCAGKTWEINSFTPQDTANTYTFDFNGMNPSRVRSGILVAFKNADGDLVSNIRVFTAEHYAASATDDSVKALTGAMMHYGDAAKAYVTRNFSSGILTEEEKTALSALTAEPYAAAKKENQEIAIWAYGEANIDVSDSFDKSVLDLMQKIFQGNGTDGRTPIPADSSSYEAKYGDMLVEGCYGGTEVMTADKVFTAADFQVGDVFCAVWNTTGYYAGIYLGDGKFLMSNNVSGDWTTAIDKTTVFSETLADDMGIYFVLRPEQLAPYVAPFVPDAPPALEDGVITRGEMEAALAEVAWDYYVKGVKVQYDSMDLNTRNDGLNEPLSKYSGGFWRTTTISTLEDADSDTYLFTVCSDYAWNVYFETLGYPILGNRLNCHTSQFWRGTEAPDDMVVMRWHNKGKGVYLSDYDDDYGMTFDDWYELEDVKDFLWNWKENLRPGDIITARTGNSAHTVLYVGNGMILHSNGEGKYNMVKGTDKPETEGSISMNYVEDYYFTEGNIFNLDAMQRASSQAWICVVRPLDILTKDDDDNDPSNDVLDPDYVLNTGKLNAQLSIDPRPLQTSGYTIKDTTFTRMAYPGMDIDRTVDITPYGTVAKGGTLTYTIEISNRSTDLKYVEYRTGVQGEAYAGEAYEGLIIEEHVPENTVLVSAPGAYVEDGTLRWQVDIPQGESVTLTYTVKVTGKIGEKIVNGGGLVANIPSNTLTNVIGGAKLSDEALEKMDAFAQADKSAWNSNDGYKITAAMTAGTVFAERIYNETTGLDLQLPEIQELMDILFNYEMINVQSCLYLSHDSDGVTRYMYTLNENAADPDNQVYCDMVIDGYFGGVWAFSNDYAGEPRIYEFRTDYLEPGDIIIHTNLTPSATDGKTEETRKVEEWNVVVYLGNSTFASLSSDGRLKKILDDSAIVPGFSYDLFVGLRPSQAYANINTDVAAFEGPAKDLTDEDIATVYKGNISNVLLNDDNAAALAALQASDFTQHSGKFIGEVYSKIGLDVVTDGTMNSSFSTVVKALFADNANDTTSETYLEYGHEYHLLEEPLGGTEKLYDMLMFYGGPAFATSKPITSLNDLHPGDAVMLGRGIKSTANYGSMDVVAVYQGDGKFLVSIRDLAGTYYDTADYKEWTAKSFTSDAEFTAWLAAPIVAGNSACFEGYVVLRPSRVFEDVNRVPYAGDNSIVPDGSEISSERSITDSLLNNAEKLEMANLTVADWVAAKKPVNLLKIPSWIYSQLNINDISNYFDQTMFFLRNGLFYKSGSWYHLSDIGRVNHVEKYHRMLVSGCYGGFNFETSRTMKESDFQIGDLFCAWTVDEHGDNIYWIGLYQGNYQFLLIRSGGNNNIKVAEEAYLTELNARISSGDYAFYFVLRPEQLVPRDITTGALTDREKKVLSSLTAEAYAATGKGNTEIVTWAYGEAGIDVSDSFDLTVWYLMKAIFDGGRGDRSLIQPGDSKYDATHSGMLVEGYYGGLAIPDEEDRTFNAADFQVGDVFIAVRYNTADKSRYYAGVYLGGGKFLMSNNYPDDTWTTAIDKTTVFSSKLASTFDIYFILRPEQLAPRDFTSGVMTNTEKAVISALTAEEYEAAAKDATVKAAGIVNWAYAQAGIDISDNFNKSVWNSMKAIFGGDANGRYPYLPNSTATEYIAEYGRMLVDGYYGGTQVTTYDKTFTKDDFQVGDVFCAVHYEGSTRSYYAGIYLGDGKFLMSGNTIGSASASIDSTTVFDEESLKAMGIYFVLRPEQLVQEAPKGLIAETRAKLAALTADDLAAAGKTNDTGVVKWFCVEEGMAEANDDSFEGIVGISTELFSKSGTIWPLKTDDNCTYHKLFVDGYYGGAKLEQDKTFTAADFEIGDIFCAQDTESNRFVGLYQGEGKFLMSVYNSTSKTITYVEGDTSAFAKDIATTYNYYFVLRPAQYLNTPAS